MSRFTTVLFACLFAACVPTSADTVSRCGTSPEQMGFVDAADLASIAQKCGPNAENTPPGAFTVTWSDLYPSDSPMQLWRVELAAYTDKAVADCWQTRLADKAGLEDIDGTAGSESNNETSESTT